MSTGRNVPLPSDYTRPRDTLGVLREVEPSASLDLNHEWAPAGFDRRHKPGAAVTDLKVGWDFTREADKERSLFYGVHQEF